MPGAGPFALSPPLILVLAALQSPDGPPGGGGLRGLTPVPFQKVRLEDPFWSPRIETNRAVTVEANLRRCEETGRIQNFARAADLVQGRGGGEHRGLLFNDSDVYKVLEGVAKTLAVHPDPQLEARADAIIATIAGAQAEDGYLDTYYTLVEPQARWTNLAHGHEMYCCGHLIEAAIAYHRATGKRLLLDVARRFADHVDRLFGEGRRLATSGHQEIELALLALAEYVGEPRYRELAEFLLLERGDPRREGLAGAYCQDERGVLEQREATGHAVRATYQYCAMTDVARLGAGPAWEDVLRDLWRDVTERKMYVTGGIGNSAHNEGFTRPYDLPNDTAYCETCASVGMALWAQRMFLLTGEAAFVDVLELELYNNLLAGVSLGGDRFFYVNPLSSEGGHARVPWFDCSCCPTNLVRTLPGVGGQVYAHRRDRLVVALYVGSSATVPLEGGAVKVRQRSAYPWSGRVELEVDGGGRGPWTLVLRRPGWCAELPTLTRGDGRAVPDFRGVEPGSWLEVPLEGDRSVHLVLDLPLVPRRLRADPRVAADAGRVALARGPVIYCLEGADHGVAGEAGRVGDLILPPGASLASRWEGELLGGVPLVVARGLRRLRHPDSGREELVPTPLRALPYHLWGNRGPGEMVVWVPEEASRATIAGEGPSLCQNGVRLAASHCWGADTLAALNDGRLPASSADHSLPRHTFWDHRGDPEWPEPEWLEYGFDAPRRLSRAAVYWFDDRGIGACRVPGAWRLVWRDGGEGEGQGEWRPVKVTGGGYGVGRDALQRVEFEPLETRAIRLEVELAEGWSAGVLEWTVGD